MHRLSRMAARRLLLRWWAWKRARGADRGRATRDERHDGQVARADAPPDPFLVVLLFLIAIYVAIAIAIAVWPHGSDDSHAEPTLHPPRTTEERAAAASAVLRMHGGRAIDARVHGSSADVIVAVNHRTVFV